METQLTIAINFPLQKILKKSVMQSRSNNVKFRSFKDTNEVVGELFELFCSRYEGNSETSMRKSNFIFDSVQLMYCKCPILNFKRSVSYIDSADSIKIKKQQ